MDNNNELKVVLLFNKAFLTYHIAFITKIYYKKQSENLFYNKNISPYCCNKKASALQKPYIKY